MEPSWDFLGLPDQVPTGSTSFSLERSCFSFSIPPSSATRVMVAGRERESADRVHVAGVRRQKADCVT